MNSRRRGVLKGLAATAAMSLTGAPLAWAQTKTDSPDLILKNGRITTLDPSRPEAQALAIVDGRIAASGTDGEVMRLAAAGTKIIDLAGRRVIPGLNDSHTHLIRGGLNYNMELRWENVPSLADALRMLKQQAERTPAPQWVRVVGVRSAWAFNIRRPSAREGTFSQRSSML